MNGLPWFRAYVDFLEDPKMVALAFEDQRHFFAILALKSAGILDQDCDAKLMNRIVAQKLWIDFALIEDVKRRLMNGGLIDEHWQPLAWDKRQYVSDHDPTRNERQRRFREKQKTKHKQTCNASDPLCNASDNASDNAEVTPLDTDPEQNRQEKNPPIIPPRGDVGEEAPSATDSKSKPKTKPKPKPKTKRKPDDDPPRGGPSELPEWLSSDLWATWRQFRKEIRVPMTPTGEKRLLNKLGRLRDDGHDPEEVINRSIENSWRGFFETQKSPPSNIVPIRKSNANDPPVDENDPREQAIQRLLRSPCPLTRRDAEEWADEKFQRTGSYESC